MGAFVARKDMVLFVVRLPVQQQYIRLLTIFDCGTVSAVVFIKIVLTYKLLMKMSGVHICIAGIQISFRPS